MVLRLEPDFGPDASSFPALPPITSETIKLQVFTHRSLFARPTHIFEDRPDDPSPDNEKYEFLGDTVLGLVVTRLLLDLHPGLRVGPATKMRALIVGNATLADISLKYELPARLRLHQAQAITLRASMNIQADVFESYVGGLYMDQGLDVVKAWLLPLFLPYTNAAYHLVRTQHGLPPLPTPSPTPLPSPADPTSSGSPPLASNVPALPTPSFVGLTTTIGHLALFNQHLHKANRSVEWVYSNGDWARDWDESTGPEVSAGISTNTTPVWAVRVLVDGEFFGRGRGNTKKAARNEAAKQGLEKMGIFVW